MNLLQWLRSAPPYDVPMAAGGLVLSQPRVLTTNDVLDVHHRMEEVTGQTVAIFGVEVDFDHRIEPDAMHTSSDLQRLHLRMSPVRPDGSEPVPEEMLECVISRDMPPFLYLKGGHALGAEHQAIANSWPIQVAPVLLKAGRPFIQRRRLIQLAIGVFDGLLAALWIIGLLTAFPGWAFAIVGTFGVAVVIVAVHRWIMARPILVTFAQTVWVRWELYDRVKLAEERAKRHADLRAALLGAGITLAIGLVIAVFTTALRVAFG